MAKQARTSRRCKGRAREGQSDKEAHWEFELYLAVQNIDHVCESHRSWTKGAAASTYSTGRRSGYAAASVTSISGTSLLSLFQKDVTLVGAASAVEEPPVGNEHPFVLMFKRLCTSNKDVPATVLTPETRAPCGNAPVVGSHSRTFVNIPFW